MLAAYGLIQGPANLVSALRHDAARSAEIKEGIKAFAEKRAPRKTQARFVLIARTCLIPGSRASA